MKKIIVLLVAAVIPLLSFAKISLSGIIGDNMVLQRNTVVKLWGKAECNKTVTVIPSWDRHTYKVKAAGDGSWLVNIRTGDAGGPYTIRISDGDERVLQNIMLGEVWICGGQSNMEMPVCGFMYQPVEQSSETILEALENPSIRMFTVPRISKAEVMDTCAGEWKTSSPASVCEFSAVGYFFGRTLTRALQGIPVGLIAMNWGGSNIETWMTEECIDAIPGIDHRLAKSLSADNRAPQRLFNGMVNPIRNFASKGFIWYQGESNRYNWFDYRKLLVAMVDLWRNVWGNAEMPFYYVQLAPHMYDGDQFRSLPLVVEAQYEALAEIPHSGIAATTDLGNRTCIHPSKKIQVGRRLAYLALTNDYGIKGLPRPAPTYKSMELVKDERRGNMLVLSFNHLSEKGRLNDPDSFHGYLPEGYSKPGGFEIAGKDRVYHPAKASYVWWENKIEVWSDEVQDPVAVRYAFRNFCPEANVATTLEQPLVPFRTDRWEVEDVGKVR